MTRTVAAAVAVACSLGVLATWLGILFAYDSPYWSSSGNALPVSFFIVAIVVATYLLTGIPWLRRGRRHAGTNEHSGRRSPDTLVTR